MKGLIAAFLGAAFLLADCRFTLPDSYVVYPDTAVPAEMLMALQAGAADWNAHVPVWISIASGPCPPSRTVEDVCVHVEAVLPTLPYEPGVLLGLTVGEDIWFAEPLLHGDSPGERQRVAAHELGHAMGLKHLGKGALMYPYGDGGSQTVTYADVVEWYFVRGMTPPGPFADGGVP